MTENPTATDFDYRTFDWANPVPDRDWPTAAELTAGPPAQPASMQAGLDALALAAFEARMEADVARMAAEDAVEAAEAAEAAAELAADEAYMAYCAAEQAEWDERDRRDAEDDARDAEREAHWDEDEAWDIEYRAAEQEDIDAAWAATAAVGCCAGPGCDHDCCRETFHMMYDLRASGRTSV